MTEHAFTYVSFCSLETHFRSYCLIVYFNGTSDWQSWWNVFVLFICLSSNLSHCEGFIIFLSIYYEVNSFKSLVMINGIWAIYSDSFFISIGTTLLIYDYNITHIYHWFVFYREFTCAMIKQMLLFCSKVVIFEAWI